MNRNNIEINVIINGRKATEFQSPMDFQTYIEGREGSNFELELVNNNATDVEMIISVDGLSITDGKAASSESGGYVIPARSRRTIPGWMVDGATAAKFFFAGAKGGSYAEQSPQGDEKNKGVIGVKAFARKPVYQNTFHSFAVAGGAMPKGGGVMRGMASSSRMKSRTRSRTSSRPPTAPAPASPTYGSNSADAASWTSTVVGSNVTASLSNAAHEPTAYSADMSDALGGSLEAIPQTLGTGFGEATKFDTTSVEFERGDLLAVIEMFYDDATGLKRRGIHVDRPSKRPSAFPADEPKGCEPPAGWKR